MKIGQRLLVASGLIMLVALPVGARAQADSFAHLHGFGEGVAAVLMTSAPVKNERSVQGFNGKVKLKTYRQPGIELQTMAGGPRAFPASLLISRPDYPLPLGLRIGDARGAVERTLGVPETSSDTVVLRRTQGEGCDDPITLHFRGGQLSQVAWTWETCTD